MFNRYVISLAVVALATTLTISCRRDPPPVEPGSTGAGGAPATTSASGAGGATATSTSSGGVPADCLTPAPAPISCVGPGDCWHGDLCSTFACDPAGHCLYRARPADRPDGVVGCDPGGTTTVYWSCQGADPASATAPGGRCCPDAAPLPSGELPRVRSR